MLDLIDGDEEILEYLSYNQHLPIARAVKNSKKYIPYFSNNKIK